MAAELITPTDEISGLPLPIAPEEPELPLDRPEVADWHHHFHPANHPTLRTVSGLALRNSRVQLVMRDRHNHSPLAYHRYFAGPEIPEDEGIQFGLVVLACAGFVPDEGIDLSKGDPRRVKLEPWQIASLRAPVPADTGCNERQRAFGLRNLRYAYDPIRDFLSTYALQQPINHIDTRLVDEFLNTRDEERKTFLGHYLLDKKVEVATERVVGSYSEARDMGMLHPLMPSNPVKVVRYKLGRSERREALFPRLAAQLAAFNYIGKLTIRGQQDIIT